jgi:4-hydroxyacetophenone monooxygenase
MWWRYGDGLLQQLHRDPAWPHPERSINRANERHREQMTAHIQAELGDRPELAARCIPDYPPFGKRILLDSGWYRAICQPNVELISEPVAGLSRNGVVTADGKERPADLIVYATGFRVGAMAARLNVFGRGGRSLADAWRDDNPTAYLGMTMPGFPNLFVMQGPNTGLGHGGSAVFQSESQARYISSMIVKMAEGDLRSVEVTQAAHDRFVLKVDTEHAKLIWSHPGVSTYYKNRGGRVFSVMPFRLVDYWRMTHEPDLENYVTG